MVAIKASKAIMRILATILLYTHIVTVGREVIEDIILYIVISIKHALVPLFLSASCPIPRNAPQNYIDQTGKNTVLRMHPSSHYNSPCTIKLE